MHIEVAPVPFEKSSECGESDESKHILHRVIATRAIQKKRFANRPGIYSNARMGTRVMRNAVNRLGLSARGFNRLLKVARTIADLAGEEEVSRTAVAEAIQYRSLDRDWG